MVQLSARDTALLILLLDLAHARSWKGSEAANASSASLARTAAFARDHAGWLPLHDTDTSQVALLLALDFGSTADVYRLAADSVAIWGPGHTQIEAEDDLPENARDQAFVRILQGPTSAARLVACLQLTQGLLILEHNVDASTRKFGTLSSGTRLVDEVTGSCGLPLPKGVYCVLVEPVCVPWSGDPVGRVAFVVPARDPRVRGADNAELAGPEHLPLLAAPGREDFLVTSGGRRLNLVERRLSTILPGVRAHAANVEELDCRNNLIVTLPPWLAELGKLKSLNLDGNRLTTLPAEIGALTNLEVLALGNNELLALPSAIGKLEKLRILSLTRNRQLKSLPREIENLGSLRELDLSGTGISELPPTLLGLGELEELNLRGTKLRSLPPFLAEFSKLSRIHIGKKMFIPSALRTAAIGGAILQY